MKKEVVEKLSTFIIAAFGLVAALAWNSAIQELFKRVFGDVNGLMAMLFYAIVVTVVAVIITIWMGKISEKLK